MKKMCTKSRRGALGTPLDKPDSLIIVGHIITSVNGIGIDIGQVPKTNLANWLAAGAEYLKFVLSCIISERKNATLKTVL